MILHLLDKWYVAHALLENGRKLIAPEKAGTDPELPDFVTDSIDDF